jgi:hypothetical protein
VGLLLGLAGSGAAPLGVRTERGVAHIVGRRATYAGARLLIESAL